LDDSTEFSSRPGDGSVDQSTLERNFPMNLGAPELLIILAVVMLLFGARKVPDLARSLGQAQREFKAGSDDAAKPKVVPATTTEPVVVAEPVPAVPADR